MFTKRGGREIVRRSVSKGQNGGGGGEQTIFETWYPARCLSLSLSLFLPSRGEIRGQSSISFLPSNVKVHNANFASKEIFKLPKSRKILLSFRYRSWEVSFLPPFPSTFLSPSFVSDPQTEYLNNDLPRKTRKKRRLIYFFPFPPLFSRTNGKEIKENNKKQVIRAWPLPCKSGRERKACATTKIMF